jgi:hypothetical protein
MIADAEYERAVVEERDYIRTGYRRHAYAWA